MQATVVPTIVCLRSLYIRSQVGQNTATTLGPVPQRSVQWGAQRAASLCMCMSPRAGVDDSAPFLSLYVLSVGIER